MLSRLRLLFQSALSLQGRLMIGLAITWVVVALLLTGSGWLAGLKLVRETNFAHLSYESRLIADEITAQVNDRLDALERLASRLDRELHRDGDGQPGVSPRRFARPSPMSSWCIVAASTVSP